jgi:hypothetical protein
MENGHLKPDEKEIISPGFDCTLKIIREIETVEKTDNLNCTLKIIEDQETSKNVRIE